MASASASATLAILPAFLLGGVAVEIQAELALSDAAIGALSATFWAAMALSGVPGGRAAERLGPTTMTRVGAGLSGLALVGAGLAGSVPVLAACMVVGGMGSGLLNPATDLTLATSVPPGRRGLAFGLKQGAVPLATVIAGLGVSVVAQTLGWRWAFIGLALLAPAVGLLMPCLGVAPRDRTAPVVPPHPSVRSFAVASGSGMAAMTATGAFYVASAVRSGTGVAAAGAFLTVASLVGAGSRLWFAWRRADHPRPYGLSAVLIAVGAIGTLGFALGARSVALLVATVMVFGAGWGWNALFVLAVVRDNPVRPAAAMGSIVAATGAGGVLGPLAFAGVQRAGGDSAAWLLVALLHAMAMVLILRGERVVRLGARPGDGQTATEPDHPPS